MASIVIATCGSCQSLPPEKAELDVAALAATSSAFQAAILEDGVVTPGEYESAVLAERACVIAAGGSAGEITETGNNELGFTYTVEAETEQARAAAEIETEACLDEHMSEVGTVWAYQQLLSPEQLDEMRPRVAACLRGVGIGVSDAFTQGQLRKLLAADPAALEGIKPCVAEFPGFFAVNPAQSHVEQDGHEE
ncbi:MAG: hypothetical protein EOO67_01500 [Microbacterium sp.]|nr:MAG: hypothetical protein EOO67_01500 [Microbacterium sp.]